MKHLNLKTVKNIAILIGLYSSQLVSQVKPALVDFDAYEKLVVEVKEHRKTRLLNADEFIKTSKEENVIILDTRSDSMYAAVHVKGAIHINFSDFTQALLDKIIPSPDTKILIYCNNNFNTKPSNIMALNASIIKLPDYSREFVSKMSSPKLSHVQFYQPKSKKKSKSKTKEKSGPNSDYSLEIPVIQKPITLALNIPTYINLYGYGYKNVYELSELVNSYENKLEFEGTSVIKKN